MKNLLYPPDIPLESKKSIICEEFTKLTKGIQGNIVIVNMWIEGETLVNEVVFNTEESRDQHRIEIEFVLKSLFDKYQIVHNKILLVTSIEKSHKVEIIRKTKLFDQLFTITQNGEILLKKGITVSQLKGVLQQGQIPATLFHTGRSNIMYLQLAGINDKELIYHYINAGARKITTECVNEAFNLLQKEVQQFFDLKYDVEVQM